MPQFYSLSDLKGKDVKALKSLVTQMHPSLNLSKPIRGVESGPKKEDWINILTGAEKRPLNFKNASSRGRKSGSASGSSRSAGSVVQEVMSPQEQFNEQWMSTVEALLSYLSTFGVNTNYPIKIGPNGDGLVVPCFMKYNEIDSKEMKTYQFNVKVISIDSPTGISLEFAQDFSLMTTDLPTGTPVKAAIDESSFEIWKEIKKFAWCFKFANPSNKFRGTCAILLETLFPDFKVPEVQPAKASIPQGGMFPIENNWTGAAASTASTASTATAAAPKVTLVTAAPPLLSGVVKSNQAVRVEGATYPVLSDEIKLDELPNLTATLPNEGDNKLLGLLNTLTDQLSAALKAFAAAPNPKDGANVLQAVSNLVFISSNVMDTNINK